MAQRPLDPPGRKPQEQDGCLDHPLGLQGVPHGRGVKFHGVVPKKASRLRRVAWMKPEAQDRNPGCLTPGRGPQ